MAQAKYFDLSLIPTSSEIVNRFYYEGFKEFQPSIFYKKTLPPSDTSIWNSPFGKVSKEAWVNRVLRETGGKSLQEAFNIVESWKEYYDTNKEAPSQTTPDRIWLDEQMESVQKAPAEKKDAISYEVTRAIDKKTALAKEAAAIPQEKAVQEEEVPVEIKNIPDLYIKPKKGEPSNLVFEDDELTTLKEYIDEQGVYENPREYSEKLAKEIVENADEEIKQSTDPEQLSLASHFIAINVTDNLLNLDIKNPKNLGVAQLHPSAVLKAVINPNDPRLSEIVDDEETRKQLSKAAQTRLLISDHDEELAQRLLFNARTVGPIATKYFLNSQDNEEYELTDRHDPQGTRLEINDLIKWLKDSASARQKIVNAIQKENPEILKTVGRNALDKMINETPWLKGMRFQVHSWPGAPSYTTYGAKGYASGIKTTYERYLASRNIPFLVTDSIEFAFPSSVLYTPAVDSTGGLSYSAILTTGETVTEIGASSSAIAITSTTAPAEMTGIAIRMGPKYGFVLGRVAVGNVSEYGVIAVSGTTRRVFTGRAAQWLGKLLLGRTAAQTAVSTGAAVATSATTAGGAAVTGITLGAILGFFATPIGAAVMALIGLTWPWIKRNLKYIAAFLAGVLLLGGIVAGLPLLIFGGVVLGLGFLSLTVGGITGAAGTVVGVGAAFIAGVTTFVLAPVARGVIIFLIIFPIFVAFVFFIINAGAYVVPPPKSIYAGVSENPYIGVEKVANPPGPFENDVFNPDEEIEYIIKITAKKGRLSNVKFSESCTVTKENASPNCPNPNPSIPSSITDEILSGSTYEFKYKRTYDTKYTDSAVTDIFTVTADSSEKTNVSDSSAATVIFGDPPVDCPSGWPIQLPQLGYSTLGISQGPQHGLYGNLEAIDVWTTIIGFKLNATHRGVVTTATTNVNSPGGFGKYVDIASVCEGEPFVSRYAHMSTIQVQLGQFIDFGQPIGETGHNGISDGPHLHYEFRGKDGYGTKGPYPNNPPYMHTPYIPKDVPYRCVNNCGVTLP